MWIWWVHPRLHLYRRVKAAKDFLFFTLTTEIVKFPYLLLTEEKRFAGFIVGVYLIEQMIEEIMQVETAKGLNLTVYEGNRVDEKHHLYGTLIEGRAMELTFPVNIAGRPWFRRLAKIVRGGCQP